MMDFSQAVKILGLGPNFTQEELKKAHRKLSVENHPDKHKSAEEMNEKQALINAARDYLSNYTTNDNTRKNDFNIHEYIRQKIDTLEKIIKYEGPIIQDESFVKATESIKKVINTFRTDVFNIFLITKEDVDHMYGICMIVIKTEFEQFKLSFYNRHYIYENEVQEIINFDCTLKEFYDQLIKIEEKYSKKSKIIRQLEKEIEKYQSYAGYERVALLVDVCKRNTLYYIEQNDFKDIEKEIKKMHQKITTEVFDAYYSIQKKISDLGTIVDAIANDEIKDKYESIKEHFDRGRSFSETEENIKKLETKINKHQELELKKSKYKEKEPIINQIYQSLIMRYSEAVKQYNIVTESAEISSLSAFLKKILQVFIKGCQEFKDLEYFNVFNSITFTNMTDDEKTMKKAIKNLNHSKSNIYIKTTNVALFDDSSFFWLDEENMIMYKVEYNASHRTITQEELETQYIPIEKILESSIFVGKHLDMLGLPIKVLYENDRVVLYYYNKKINVSSKQKFYRQSFYKESDQTLDASFDLFKDKEYVYEMVEKQVKESVEEYRGAKFNTVDEYHYDESGNRRRR